MAPKIPKKPDDPLLEGSELDALMEEALLQGLGEPKEEDRDPAPVQGRGRRKRFRVDGRVDLHGYTQDQAAQVLSAKVAQMQREQAGLLLVVTGRGLHSPEGSVLKQWITPWALQRAPGAPLRVEPARVEHGGQGAVYLFLKPGSGRP